MPQATLSSQESETLQEAHASPREKVKRGFDILFSSVFLLTTSPLFLLLFLLVGCTSTGPILYRSVRLGKSGKVIYCWKFRTMYTDAEARLDLLLKEHPELRREWDIYQKLKNDPRVTRVGKILRKTSLDELPQFWNVLRGDLSVVGPRPPTLVGPPQLYLKELHGIYGPSTFRILSVRPGITGPWQVSGRSKIPMEERRKLEEEYARNYNFGKDLWIIAKTIPAVLFSRGAC
jgi:undecaprenyl-phosphate galactose phosphotransferase